MGKLTNTLVSYKKINSTEPDIISGEKLISTFISTQDLQCKSIILFIIILNSVAHFVFHTKNLKVKKKKIKLNYNHLNFIFILKFYLTNQTIYWQVCEHTKVP